MVINRKHLANSKVQQIKSGYSAFTESSEIARHIEKEVRKLNMQVHIDHTPMGSWYIPVQE